MRPPRKTSLVTLTFGFCLVLFFQQETFAQEAITNGPRDQKKVALTFDACPAHDVEVDWNVLDILIQTHTPATLFLSGKWMERFSEATKKLTEIPFFEMGIHSYSHPHMTHLPEVAQRAELQKAREILFHLTGVWTHFFRPPYGEYDERLVKVADSLGLEIIEYDLASGDPNPSFSSEKLTRSVVRQAKNGSIIVMHMNGRGWHTAEALSGIIEKLNDKGFEFVTVGQLLAGQEKWNEQASLIPKF